MAYFRRVAVGLVASVGVFVAASAFFAGFAQAAPGEFTDSGQSLGTSTGWDAALGDLDGAGNPDVIVGTDLGTAIGLNDGAGKAVKERVLNAFARAPLTFIPNAGQVDSKVRYYAQGRNHAVYFTAESMVLVLAESATLGDMEAIEPVALGGTADRKPTRKVRGVALGLRFLGANPKATIEARNAARTKVSYFKGNDPASWRQGLPTYREVVYRNLWPGIDLVFRGDGAKLKYDLIVSPGAPVEAVRLAYAGADAVSLDDAGNLRIATPLGTLIDEKPVSYQVIDGRRVPVDVAVAIGARTADQTAYGFEIRSGYDPAFPLIIDPTLEYSTFLGGSGRPDNFAMTIDGAGSIYVAGAMQSADFDFPTTMGAFDTTFDGGVFDSYVAKLDPAGNGAADLIYSTLLGSGNYDRILDIAVDAAGNAYVTGLTGLAGSVFFPTTMGAFDTSFNGGRFDGFVTVLDPAGENLLYSTYLGGSKIDTFSFEGGIGIALDDAGNIYVTGVTNSGDFPTTTGAFDTSFNGTEDAFVTVLDPAGNGASDLLYSTFLGGSGRFERGWDIKVDGTGKVYVAGRAQTTTFPTTVGAFDRTFNGGGRDFFIAKLDPAGNGAADLLYSTFLGGSGDDFGISLAIDSAGKIYVSGGTNSANFPTTAGAFDTSFNGGVRDAIVAVLDPAGNGAADLLYATFLGGGTNDLPGGIAVDESGMAFVVGGTDSADFPVTADALQQTSNGVFDAYIAVLAPDTAIVPASDQLVFSTFLGGSLIGVAKGIALDSAGDVYVVGVTGSADFPTTAGAFDITHNGDLDLFVAIIGMNPNSPPIAVAGGPYEVDEGGSVPVDAGASSDPEEDTLTFAWDFDNDGQFDDATVVNPTFAAAGLDGPSIAIISVEVSDPSGGTDIADATVMIDNVAPEVGDITAPIDPVALGTSIQASASFTDAGTPDTHTAEWDWGDGTVEAGTVTQGSGSGSVADSHTYTLPGVYTVTLTVADDDDDSASSTFEFVVVFDPEGSFVTGAGTIDSPAGAYVADPSLTGLANFGFFSRYKKGTNEPIGRTRFLFHAAGLIFMSDTYQWLVVAGARAQFKGIGTIQGSAGSYGFFVTAIDGQVNGGGGADKFRIKIWESTNDEAVVYDNELGAATDADPTTLSQGSIVIHN